MTVPSIPGDPYEVLDDRFESVRGDVGLERLFEGCRWAEGPVYVPAGRYLAWSDIPNDRMLRWDETTGAVGVFRLPSGYANGNTLDANGRMLTCEHGNRRITRTEHSGATTVIAERFEGKRLNSPNDVVSASDGAVWFTDASYGIDSDYEGNRAESELDACYVFRVDPVSAACAIVADGFLRPTGIAFSPDESRLYVVDSRANHIRAFEIDDGQTLRGDEVFATNTSTNFDGCRIDEAGRVWVAARDGVHCHDEDGALLGKIRVPEAATANIEFGGPKRNRMFICASESLYSIMLGVNGAARPVHRPVTA